MVRASSPRALVYNEEEFTHRTVIMTEVDSMPEDGPAASAIRSLMSDGEMIYEVVEKGEDGRHQTRKIRKPGPTGLVTTSTRPLGDQATTRTLTVPISDSGEQTRLILHAQADRANDTLGHPDLQRWTALQRWLQLAGEHRVVVPFAHPLADGMPANATRMRRDFPQLLTTIKTIALLHQPLREKDEQGRISATLEDYAITRWLLEDVFTTTVHEGVTPAVRETVEAVAELSLDGTAISEQDLVKKLKLAKSTVSYRVKRAVKGGYLVNQTTQKGAPAQLVLGAPLPEGNPLPKPEDLLARVEDSADDSNSRTPASESATPEIRTDRSSGVRTGFESGSNGDSNVDHSYVDRRFERFEGFPGGTTQTKTEETEVQGEIPWDSFLTEVNEDEPDAD